MTEHLHPGAAHPNGPTGSVDLAERLHVDPAQLQAWSQEGLPLDQDGIGDPFAVVNWITWNRLASSPVLRRAWRGYLLVFSDFLGGNTSPRHLRWRRSQTAFLPQQDCTWTWLLPRPWSGPEQRVRSDDGCGGLPAGAWWRISGSGRPTVTGTVGLTLHPQRHHTDAIAQDLLQPLIDFAASFTYGYRHHAVDETLASPLRQDGSCLDAARSFAALARQRGHDAQVVAGIIANDAFANPHFWVEVRDGQRRIPFDPSLVAIARMLKADWQAVARYYAGGCDARRIRLMQAVMPGVTLAGAIGSLRVDDRDAWACLDWVCGECSEGFDVLPESLPA